MLMAPKATREQRLYTTVMSYVERSGLTLNESELSQACAIAQAYENSGRISQLEAVDAYLEEKRVPRVVKSQRKLF